jgi:putative restriction endonuclease
LKAFVGVTDNDWFAFLAGLPDVDEVNFWQPSGSQLFKALNPGEPFLFKLHSPLNYITGGGFFAYSSICPLSLAWDAFGEKNGASSLLEMSKRIGKYRGHVPASTEDYQIGCILLEQPFFFPRDQWIPVPDDWKPEIVQGKGYDLTKGIGKRLWDEVQLRLQGRVKLPKEGKVKEEQSRYGKLTLITPVSASWLPMPTSVVVP